MNTTTAAAAELMPNNSLECKIPHPRVSDVYKDDLNMQYDINAGPAKGF